MKHSPLVSVIIRTYRGEGTIARALESVLAQDYPALHIVVVVDQSHNPILENILQDFKNRYPSLVCITNQSTLLQTKTLIVGRNYAQQSDYIAVLDDDDYRTDNTKISQQVEYLESHQECAIVGTYSTIVDTRGKLIAMRKDPVSDNEIRRYILEGSQYIHSSVLRRKSSVDVLGGYDPQRNGAEDYECILRIGTQYKFAMIPVYMTAYTINPQGVTRQKMFAQCLLSLRLARHYRNYYPWNRKTFLKPGRRYIKHLLSF